MNVMASPNSISQQAVKGHLADIFGFTHFRPYQEEIVAAILNGHDALAVMPTGGGKSLCFQLPASLLPGTAIVVSPLLSLMKDQVDACRALGLSVATLNSQTPSYERGGIITALSQGQLDLLYLSPERLAMEDFRSFLRNCPISFFAVDEAHCISEWGHDFRPDYLCLATLKEEFQKPVAAFTATATGRVSQDIIGRLKLENPYLVRASFNRPNLYYKVLPKTDVDVQIENFLKKHQGESGIIYRLSRRKVEETALYLQKKGYTAQAYHAGLADDVRSGVQENFQNDRCQIIVATIAFGMGIDKSNVRFVVHGDLPKNLENYYQETGRAGRDGEPAFCLLLYGRQDMVQLRVFANGIENPAGRDAALKQLRQMIDYAQSEKCRRQSILGYFHEKYEEDNCHACDICQGEVEKVEATVAAQKALSAIARTGGTFGAVHLVNILTGRANKAITACGHHLLPTFGVGADQDKSYWRWVIDSLLSQGLASLDSAEFPTPKVTEKGWQVMRGQLPFFMLAPAQAAPQRVRRRQKKVAESNCSFEHSTANNTVATASQNLFDDLKKLRLKLATEQNVPPYVIFSDRSLREMAQSLPQTADDFLAVTGVGKHKLDVYGSIFLKAIAAFTAEN